MTQENLSLRLFQPEDCHRILEILTDLSVRETYMLPDFAQKEDAMPLFRRLMELSANPSRYVRCICLENIPVGFLNDVEINDGSIELGYVIHPDSQGCGYMTQALQTAIRELTRLGYQRILCGAFETNTASIRVMEKCGMQRLSYTDEIQYRGRSHRCVYFAAGNEEPL